jgi:hypothetical protein
MSIYFIGWLVFSLIEVDSDLDARQRQVAKADYRFNRFLARERIKQADHEDSIAGQELPQCVITNK